MILIVGDKPSKANKHPDVPFVGCKSYKTLLDWIYRLDINISEVQIVNRTHQHFTGYISMLSHDPSVRIITLGNNASEAVAKHTDNFFKLPHPSGLNRKLNDKKFIAAELKRCMEYLNE